MKIKNKEVKIININKKTVYDNKTDNYVYLLGKNYFNINNITYKMEMKMNYTGSKIPQFYIVNRKMNTLCKYNVNEQIIYWFNVTGKVTYMIEVPPHCKIYVLDTIMNPFGEEDYGELLNVESLLLTPGYPSISDRYLCGFVHTRMKAYLEEKKSIAVLFVTDCNETTIYTYEDVRVIKLNYNKLRELLMRYRFDRIMIHFFNDRFASTLDGIDFRNTKLYFYCHGAETLYYDWEKLMRGYFSQKPVIDEGMKNWFAEKDRWIKKYNEYKNGKWIFVTPWTKKRSEELLKIKYKNYDIIPCLGDENIFQFQEKDPELRKKIFIIRKFHNINSYSIDTDVRVILELSKRSFFNDLEFDIYGDGPLHEMLLAPVRQFSNVHIHQKFLTHTEIAQMHREHGIGLFATRFDSQAVSSCEAASSGCVVISSDIPGVCQEFDKKLNTLCDPENYKEYADVIERLYYKPDEFSKISKLQSKKIHDIYGYEQTIAKDIKMFKDDTVKPKLKDSEKILTIVIPMYNVGKYIRQTLISLMDHKNVNKLEILAVNDGSSDNTLEVVNEYVKSVDPKNKIIKVIDKENGGHGSVLNVGLEKATGKYFKIIDGDDTVNTENFEKLIDILEESDSDIVLTNYCEDLIYQKVINPVHLYNMLSEGVQYELEDLNYSGYGFNEWGPILSTSAYKLSALLSRPFKITEKIAYDDMEWNINATINCNTVEYHNLDIYNYLIGRQGQSISLESLMKKYPMHRVMVNNLLETYYANKDNISYHKSQYIERLLIIKMITTHYNLVFDSIRLRKAFVDFDEMLKKFPEFYNNPIIVGHKIKLFRKTNGRFIKLLKYEPKIKKLLKR